MTGEAADDERALWDRILTTDQETAFREFVVETLPLNPDDRVLSAGCGPGFETAALAERVPDGHVTGIDVNEAVIEAARERCRDRPVVAFEQGDVTDLPFPDGHFDLVLAKQVCSEIDDVATALAELRRVTRPGGRVAVTAGDRRSHVTHTPTDLLERADEIYRAEMGGRQLGTRLVGLLPEAGLEVTAIHPQAKLQTDIDDQVERGIEVQRRFLEASDDFDDADVDAWEAAVRGLAAEDRYLSCGTSFLYVARRPA